MLEAILAPLIHFVTETIGGYGVPAVFVLMLLESMGILIPSEAISPFAGYLVSEGRMTLFAAVTAGVLGNLVGSWVAYFIGLWGGRELWFRYGRYVGVRAHHLDVAEKWFDRYGELTVFVSRCLPVVRTFISFPAGTAKMNLTKFSVYTLLGCIPWVFALTYLGYVLGENWERIGDFLHYLDYAVAVAFIVGVVYVIWRWRSSRK
ncbi:DedA family protein [Rubrobacter tropicus]|uniref:DedA family protein n=1 Tax=Rubrobacter tropicus TaxID=2653851 RepID=A0A6G8Q481_9ACTN|nr:DedA family protein [Rubrobacter tropicus]QIN81282.1 DedA family protein [Rubrobacter tropicus]